MIRSVLRPRILIVDDDPRIGRGLKELIEREFDCTVCFPQTVEALQKTVLNEAFDSVLVDTKLNRWSLPISVFGEYINDGIDFARAYCRVQPECLIVIFGPSLLPFKEIVDTRIAKLSSCKIKTLDRPLPSRLSELQAVLKVLKPGIEETAIIHQANPIFLPFEVHQGLPEEEKFLRDRLLYKQACQRMEKLVNINLQEYGDSSWTVLCGGNFQKGYYGELLNGHSASSLDVNIMKRYPRKGELKELARAEKTNAFVFWNTRGPSILSKQFSDERLEKIPETLADEFGMAVADSCAEAYHQDADNHVIQWCKNLSPLGRLDVVKAIFKSLNGGRKTSLKVLSQRCKRARLSRIVDVYNARVEKIIEDKNTAIIELTNLAGDDSFAAPFDLGKLKGKGIKERDQSFEYSVWISELEHSFGQIELTE